MAAMKTLVKLHCIMVYCLKQDILPIPRYSEYKQHTPLNCLVTFGCTSGKLSSGLYTPHRDSTYIQFSDTSGSGMQIYTAYFTHTFRLSQLHQDDQGVLPDRFYWKLIEKFLVQLHQLVFFCQKTYLATFLAFLLQLRNSPGAEVQDQTSPEMLINWLSERDTNLTKEASFSPTLWFKL